MSSQSKRDLTAKRRMTLEEYKEQLEKNKELVLDQVKRVVTRGETSRLSRSTPTLDSPPADYAKIRGAVSTSVKHLMRTWKIASTALEKVAAEQSASRARA